MKDLIDERNFKEKCTRSIVKNYNVHYISKEELEAQQFAKAQAIVQNAKAGTHVREYLRENQMLTENPVNEVLENDDLVTEEQIRKILDEKEEHLNEIIEEYKI